MFLSMKWRVSIYKSKYITTMLFFKKYLLSISNLKLRKSIRFALSHFYGHRCRHITSSDMRYFFSKYKRKLGCLAIFFLGFRSFEPFFWTRFLKSLYIQRIFQDLDDLEERITLSIPDTKITCLDIECHFIMYSSCSHAFHF